MLFNQKRWKGSEVFYSVVYTNARCKTIKYSLSYKWLKVVPLSSRLDWTPAKVKYWKIWKNITNAARKIVILLGHPSKMRQYRK